MSTTNAKTIEFGFDTRLTTLATATTLAGATRHDFSAVTVYIPESTPVFESVMVEITWRDADATGTINFNGYRCGIKLGAVAFTDTDVTFAPAMGATGDHRFFRAFADVTAYFTTNWTGASMAAQIGVAFSQASASVVQNITAKLIITYHHSDAATTRVKTVRIPIQSQTTTLTNVAQEIGTDGTNPAAANQIPALDTFLPESSKVYRNVFLQVEANEAANASTTNHNLSVQIDANPALTRATLVQTLATSVTFEDIIPYDTATYLTNAAHALKMSGSTTGRFRFACAFLIVTYEYDESASTRLMQSLMVPLDSRHGARYVNGSTSAQADRYTVSLHVGEPGTITLVQSGVYFRLGQGGINAGTLVIWAGGQSVRTLTTAAEVYANELPIIHRVDQGSGWSLAAGKNTLYFSAYNSAAQQSMFRINGGFACINYTSDKHPSGSDKHNATTLYFGNDWLSTGEAAQQVEHPSSVQARPTMPARYRISNWSMEVLYRYSTAILESTVGLALAGGELGAAGYVTRNIIGECDGEDSVVTHTTDFTAETLASDQDPSGRMNPGNARKVVFQQGSSLCHCFRYYLTMHSCTYSVSGSVGGYSGNGSGITVEFWSNAEYTRIGTAVTAVGGGATGTVYDKVASGYFAVARQNSSLHGRSDNQTPT